MKHRASERKPGPPSSRSAAAGLSVALACAFVSSAAAQAAPNLKSLRPIGAKRGTTFTLTLVGTDLTPGSDLITTLPATITRLSAATDLRTPETELPFLIDLRADAQVAVYPIRLRGPEGISNLLLFSVGDFSELTIVKDPDPPPGAPRRKAPVPKVTPPLTINSYLRAAEQDEFRFSASAGQALVFEAEARRIGSALDPVIRIFDSASREIAFNDDAPGLGVDARVQVRFPHDGEYRVVIHDSRLSDQDQNSYRLKIGNYLFADGFFPLGWRRARNTRVEFFGGNLPRPVVIEPNLDLPDSHSVAMISLPDRKGRTGSLPLPFVLSDRDEILERNEKGPGRLTPDLVVNGRITVPGEKDLYRLEVKPGEKWLFEVQAAALGTTRLGAHLSIFDPDMNLLKSVVDTSQLNPPTTFSFVPRETGIDPKIVFEIPSRSDQTLREVILCVEDLNHGGGPEYSYRLMASKDHEDFGLEFINPFANVPAGGSAAVAVRVLRDSYSGPIRLSVPDPKGLFQVEGGHIPRGIREGILVVSAPRLAISDLEVWGEGVSEDGRRIRRRVRGPGLITPVKGERRQVGGSSVATQKPYQAGWLGMELPIGVSKAPPVALTVSDTEFKLVQGHKHTVRAKVARNVPVTTPIRIEGIRPGGIDITIRGGTLDAKAESVPVEVSANFNAAVGVFDMVLTARVDVGGKVEQVASESMRVELVRAFVVHLPSPRMDVAPDAIHPLEGKIHRQYPFQDSVDLKVEDLPIHVTSEPITVPAHESAFAMNLRIGPHAVPGDYDIRLIASAPMGGRKDDKDYSIPDSHVKLRIAPKPTESGRQEARFEPARGDRPRERKRR